MREMKRHARTHLIPPLRDCFDVLSFRFCHYPHLHLFFARSIHTVIYTAMIWCWDMIRTLSGQFTISDIFEFGVEMNGKFTLMEEVEKDVIIFTFLLSLHTLHTDETRQFLSAEDDINECSDG